MTALSDADIEAIERATVEAVAPEAKEEWSGWLLPFDHGTISRAKAAVPLRHAPFDAEGVIDAIETRYRDRGLAPAFRLADVPPFEPIARLLAARGYHGAKASIVQTASVGHMRNVTSAPPADVDDTPDVGWAAMFLGEGFEPVDGANRVRALTRAPDSRYASLRIDGRTVACGTIAFGHGWASIHGMRTEMAHRGQGHAARVLAGLAGAAQARGVTRVFLQVEADNPAAHALYRRAGFRSAWHYRYWQTN